MRVSIFIFGVAAVAGPALALESSLSSTSVDVALTAVPSAYVGSQSPSSVVPYAVSPTYPPINNTTRPNNTSTIAGSSTHVTSTGSRPATYTGGADAMNAGQWMGFAALLGLFFL